ncbi:hypothetical protein PAESOLCIP111_03525 [Paenibacillus solanacearum]|uniref:Flagellar protein n=1 Tax=Paenibacillus solanacearum TaxID=2048548 RepID=A0A916K676_9BACL|nr:flagellar protein [Paenibacillus solanacearum]CAG7634037.1 hypothetical protein PAESOLCIP111_03525 [Paenibacillus solanacearum]
MSLNVVNCYRCGKIHIKNSYNMCPNCIKEVEQQYLKCTEYLRQNKQCTLQELSDATGVPVNVITKFIREGRISIRSNPNVVYHCEVCGTDIREGTICESCRARLAKEASHIQEDEKRRLAQQQQENNASYNIKDRLKDRLK